MPSRLQPAFWGGLFIGVLSALPFVGDLNACCCVWVMAGGVLTSYILQERTFVPITAGDGAVAGLIAGAIGAVLASVLSPLIAFVRGISPRDAIEQLVSRGDLPPAIVEAFAQLKDVPGWVWVIASLAVSLLVYPIFAMLGSLLGVAIFKRKVPPPPGTVDVLPPEQRG